MHLTYRTRWLGFAHHKCAQDASISLELGSNLTQSLFCNNVLSISHSSLNPVLKVETGWLCGDRMVFSERVVGPSDPVAAPERRLAARHHQRGSHAHPSLGEDQNSKCAFYWMWSTLHHCQLNRRKSGTVCTVIPPSHTASLLRVSVAGGPPRSDNPPSDTSSEGQW